MKHQACISDVIISKNEEKYSVIFEYTVWIYNDAKKFKSMYPPKFLNNPEFTNKIPNWENLQTFEELAGYRRVLLGMPLFVTIKQIKNLLVIDEIFPRDESKVYFQGFITSVSKIVGINTEQVCQITCSLLIGDKFKKFRSSFSDVYKSWDGFLSSLGMSEEEIKQFLKKGIYNLAGMPIMATLKRYGKKSYQLNEIRRRF